MTRSVELQGKGGGGGRGSFCLPTWWPPKHTQPHYILFRHKLYIGLRGAQFSLSVILVINDWSKNRGRQFADYYFLLFKFDPFRNDYSTSPKSEATCVTAFSPTSLRFRHEFRIFSKPKKNTQQILQTWKWYLPFNDVQLSFFVSFTLNAFIDGAEPQFSQEKVL